MKLTLNTPQENASQYKTVSFEPNYIKSAVQRLADILFFDYISETRVKNHDDKEITIENGNHTLTIPIKVFLWELMSIITTDPRAYTAHIPEYHVDFMFSSDDLLESTLFVTWYPSSFSKKPPVTVTYFFSYPAQPSFSKLQQTVQLSEEDILKVLNEPDSSPFDPKFNVKHLCLVGWDTDLPGQSQWLHITEAGTYSFPSNEVIENIVEYSCRDLIISPYMVEITFTYSDEPICKEDVETYPVKSVELVFMTWDKAN